jgi:hypothetical protein
MKRRSGQRGSLLPLVAAAVAALLVNLTPFDAHSRRAEYRGPSPAGAAHAYVHGGAPAQYVALPAFGTDGHQVFSAAAGRALWQQPVEEFLSKAR